MEGSYVFLQCVLFLFRWPGDLSHMVTVEILARRKTTNVEADGAAEAAGAAEMAPLAGVVGKASAGGPAA